MSDKDQGFVNEILEGDANFCVYLRIKREGRNLIQRPFLKKKKNHPGAENTQTCYREGGNRWQRNVFLNCETNWLSSLFSISLFVPHSLSHILGMIPTDSPTLILAHISPPILKLDFPYSPQDVREKFARGNK